MARFQKCFYFVSFADRHAPIIQRRVRGIDNCPWLNKEIKSVMRRRDYFYSTARKTNHSGLVIVAIEIVCRALQEGKGGQ